MKYDIKVPSMGESISEATVGTIIKPTGAVVAMDDELLELETDKVNQVLYAPRAGVVTLTVKPEDVVKIGQVIGFVQEGAAEVASQPECKKSESASPQVNVEQQSLPKDKKQVPSQAQTPPQVAQTENKGSVRITKDVWLKELKNPKLNKELEPTVVSAGVSRPIDERSRTEKRTKMSKIRRLIANRLVEVQKNTAMLTTFNEVDMTAVMELRDKYKEVFLKEHGVKLGFMSFFVKACTAAMRAYPGVNSYIDAEDIVQREYVDIGIAVGTERGLIVPVVRDCDKLTFAQVEQKIEVYARKARGGGLSVDDLQGGGFTITNGGVYGSLLSTPILNPPQCAILGMHKIMKRAVVVDDQIVIRQMMYLALSYDHRLIDGKEAVSFLVHIKNTLEDPSRLLLEV